MTLNSTECRGPGVEIEFWPLGSEGSRTRIPCILHEDLLAAVLLWEDKVCLCWLPWCLSAVWCLLTRVRVCVYVVRNVKSGAYMHSVRVDNCVCVVRNVKSGAYIHSLRVDDWVCVCGSVLHEEGCWIARSLGVASDEWCGGWGRMLLWAGFRCQGLARAGP